MRDITINITQSHALTHTLSEFKLKSAHRPVCLKPTNELFRRIKRFVNGLYIDFICWTR